MKRFVKVIPLLICMSLAIISICLGSEHGGEGGGSQLKEMGFRIFNFLFLFALLWKLLADKIKKYFVDRRLEIAQMLEDVERKKADAEKQYHEYQQLMQNAEKDIQGIRESLTGEIELEKQRIIQEGKTSAERIVEQAKWSAEQEVLKAKRDLRNHVIEMAGDMAVGMITKNMTPNDQKIIIEDYLDKVVKEN